MTTFQTFIAGFLTVGALFFGIVVSYELKLPSPVPGVLVGAFTVAIGVFGTFIGRMLSVQQTVGQATPVKALTTDVTAEAVDKATNDSGGG